MVRRLGPPGVPPDVPYVGYAVSTLTAPSVPSTRRRCARCGQDVWCAEAQQSEWRSRRVICMACAVVELES